MRLSHAKPICLLIVGTLLSLSWFTRKTTDDEVVEQRPPNLQLLNERLMVAEETGVLLSKELNTVLLELKTLRAGQRNSTYRKSDVSSDLLPLLYLPHVRPHKDSLRPRVLLSQGRSGVSLVLGIPTVQRQRESYLINTLGSLLFNLPSDEQRDIVIIVFIAEIDDEYISSVAQNIRTNFPDDVESGLLEVISCSPFFYPNLSSVRETFGDTKERVKWRTKQNLDYSFLMLYAQSKGTYYAQLEDDIVATPGYSVKMKTFARTLVSNNWIYLEFSQLGFIGKMFRSSDLPMIVEFILMFHKDKPIDWLLDHILLVKGCNPEKSAKECNEQKALLKPRHKPSLFQHIGIHSSLAGKIQNLMDKDWDSKQGLFVAHSNPRAAVSSSLVAYQEHTLERAYAGQDFFWGTNPKARDVILFHFHQPQAVTGYLFHSGNFKTNGDKLYNTTVEVLSRDVTGLDSEQFTGYKRSQDGFVIIGSFVKGVAEGVVPAALRPLSALRLVIHSDSDVWVLLSEILIKV